MKTSPRSIKLASVVTEMLPIIIQQLATPNQIGFMTISGIEVSGDLGVANVFVSVLGFDSKKAVEHLQKISRKISTQLSKKVELRRKMELRFHIDNTVGNMRKLNNI